MLSINPRLIGPVRHASYRFGSAFWRLDRALRSRLVFETQIPKLRGARTWTLGSNELVEPAPPKPNGCLPTLGHQISARRYKLRPRMVAEIPEMRLVGRNAAAVTRDGELLLTAYRDAPRILGLERDNTLLDWLKSSRSRTWDAGTCKFNGVVFSTVNRLDSNYFHWLVETCSQLEGVERYREATGNEATVFVRKNGAAFQKASLALLGVEENQMKDWEGDRAVAVEKFLVSSIPGDRVSCSPESLRWLRKRFLKASGTDCTEANAYRLIYIRRRKGGWRTIANEDEVISMLIERGFEVMAAEEISFGEQVLYFSVARVVLGFHGAGLTNILFAPHAALVELIGGYGDSDYYSMAACLDQPYYVLACEPAGSDGHDVLVDLKSLSSLLDTIPV